MRYFYYVLRVRIIYVYLENYSCHPKMFSRVLCPFRFLCFPFLGFKRKSFFSVLLKSSPYRHLYENVSYRILEWILSPFFSLIHLYFNFIGIRYMYKTSLREFSGFFFYFYTFEEKPKFFTVFIKILSLFSGFPLFRGFVPVFCCFVWVLFVRFFFLTSFFFGVIRLKRIQK